MRSIKKTIAEAVAKIPTAGGDVVCSYKESLRGQPVILPVVPIDPVKANPSGATSQTQFINVWAGWSAIKLGVTIL